MAEDRSGKEQPGGAGSAPAGDPAVAPQIAPIARPGFALIAGGGIAGLATALALARKGIGSVVLERRSTPAEEGAGIQIGPNGVRILKELGVAPFLTPVVGVPQAIVVRQGRTGDELTRLPLGPWIAERHGEPYWVAHRADLHAALNARVEPHPLITRLAGFEVVAAETRGGTVMAKAADGRTRTGATLIGADGLWSRVRSMVADGSAPRPTRRLAARAVVPAGEAPWSLRTNETGVWMAPGAHVVHYPVRGGRELAVVVVFDDRKRSPETATEWDRDAEPADIQAAVSDLAPAVRSLIAAVAAWRIWRLHDMTPPARLSRGPIGLVGDAAHPMLPLLAQGAVMALEDASVLAEEIASRPFDLGTAFERYAARRVSRTSHVVTQARRNGWIYHLGGWPAVARDLALRQMGGERIIAGYDWLYGWKA